MLNLTILLATFSLFSVSHINAQPLPPAVAALLVENDISSAGLGIFVQEVGATEPMLAIGDDVPLNPASVIKLLTTFVALEQLGPSHQWATDAYTDTELSTGTLLGNLYIRGGADPYLVTERFWKFLFELQLAGIKHIKGDVIIDTDSYRPDNINPGQLDDQPSRPYNTPPNALLLNLGVSYFWIVGDKKTQSVFIGTDPPNRKLKITNSVRLTNDICTPSSERLIFEIITRENGGHVKVSGDYPLGCGRSLHARRVADPISHIDGVFTEIWGSLGGTLAGKVRNGSIPDDAKKFYSYASLPLVDIIRLTNKFSNNVMARQILLTLGASKFGEPGTILKGRKAINGWVEEAGLNVPNMFIENGAGLSRKTRVSASQLGTFLLYAYQRPLIAEFIASLPISGIDGTVRKRFQKTPSAGRMHIKTGTLDNVRALAGYVLRNDGKTYVIVSLHNHDGIHKGIGTKIQDKLIAWLFEQ